MSAAEETETFRALRQRHRTQTRLVREQSRQLRKAEERERQMRAQLQTLAEPGVLAYAKIVRRRADLTMSEALALVSQAFSE